MTVCSKCGFDNELGRTFCHSCGARLDLSAIKAPSQGGKSLKKKASGEPVQLIKYAIHVLIALTVVMVVYLAALVPSVRPVKTTGQDLRSMDIKRIDLRRSISESKPQKISMTEGELKAFTDMITFKKGEGFMAMTPSNLQIELGDGVVRVICVNTLSFSNWFDKGICLTYTGTPMINSGHFVFKPVSGAIGLLPVHPWILEKTGLFDQYFGRLFLNLNDEKKTLDSLQSISVTPQEIVLDYAP
jgi:hypothetical protein